MNFSGNPMIQKELRQRMRERRGWVLPSLYLVALGAVVTFAYFETALNSSSTVQGYEIGVSLFLTAAFTQLALLLLLAPIFSAGALTIEKEQRTLAGLLTSLLSAAQIWWGKLVASLLFVMLLLVAGLPILSVAFAFGGIGIWDIVVSSFTAVVILGTVSTISLYWSSAFRRSVHATAVSYVSVIIITAVPWIIVAVAESRPVRALQDLPFVIRAPLFLNPAFFFIASLVPRSQLYPEWFWCLVTFIGVAVLCSLLTVRNIRRSGDIS